MKVREVITLVERDGWYLVRMRGDHRQYKHPRGVSAMMSQDSYPPIRQLIPEILERLEDLEHSIVSVLKETVPLSEEELQTPKGRAIDNLNLQYQRVYAVKAEIKQAMVAWIISHQLLRQGLGLEEGRCRGRAIELGQLGGRRGGRAFVRQAVRRCRARM
jgi:predicted RNA binding protein YcfA (HicA-like mRNA interferase family)